MTTDANALRVALDELAMWVAERLDAGDDASAWVATRAVEHLATADLPGDQRPANPIIGHRFAAAHRRLLRGGTARGVQPARFTAQESLELQVCA